MDPHELLSCISFLCSLAYFLYSVAIRPEVKENNPDASFGDIAKIISAQFKALPEKERAKWEAKAAADKERYQAEMESESPFVCICTFWFISFTSMLTCLFIAAIFL